MTESTTGLAPLVVVSDSASMMEAPTIGEKRRRSSADFNDAKRVKAEHDNTAAGAGHENGLSQRENSMRERGPNGARRNGQTEERKRGQRLFGALLGTITRDSRPSVVSKHRAEVEKKQRERLGILSEEDLERRTERLKALTERRHKEQVNFDRQSLQIKHSNVLSQANFLKTTAKPVLYYKPRKLLPEQGQSIIYQIQQIKRMNEAKADEAIGQSADTAHSSKPEINFDENNPERQAEASGKPAQADGDITMKYDDTNTPSPLKIAESQARPSDSLPPNQKQDPGGTKEPGDDGDEVVEGDEDNVLY